MKANASAIDRLLAAAGRLGHPWSQVGLGGGLLGAFYLFGVNRNLLYLSMLFSAIVVMSALLRRWWTAMLSIGACGYLACMPAGVPDLGRLYPAPRNIPGAERMWVTEIGKGETWTYRFNLGDTVGHDGGAAPAGYLYIDGRNLSSLVIGVQGRAVAGAGFCSKKNGLDHIAVPLGNEPAGTLEVTLRGMPQSAPRIFRGPEVHGFDVYSDAVWLEFTGNEDRMIYHAKRTVAPPAPR
jgi:hypothetical protein